MILSMTKKVRCIDCGYLYHHRQEMRFSGPMGKGMTPAQVREFANRRPANVAKQAGLLRCFRHGAFDSERRTDDNAAALLRLATEARTCTLYFRYVPGYGPEKHMELREAEGTQVSQRRWQLGFLAVGTILGAAVTKLVGLI